MLLKEYNKGDIVFREGDRGNCMYRIIEGSVEVFITSGTEGEIVLTTLGQDRIFGEMAAIEAWPRSASIMVREDGTKLLEIARDELVEFFKDWEYTDQLLTGTGWLHISWNPFAQPRHYVRVGYYKSI